MLNSVDKKIKALVEALDLPADNVPGICAAALIHRLAQADGWSTAQLAQLDQLSRRIDISGVLYSQYQQNWRKVDDTRLQEPWLGLLVLILYKFFLLSLEDSFFSGLAAKRMNVLLKALQLTTADYLSEGSLLQQGILDDFSRLSESARTANSPTVTSLVNSPEPATALKKIPLTVLFYEGPIARAYLETIRSLGLAPHKIICMVSSRDVSDGKPVGRILPGMLRKNYAAAVQRSKIHFWPRQIRKNHPHLVGAVAREVEQKFCFPVDTQNQSASLRGLSEYSDNIDYRLVTGIKDPALQEYLASEPESTILFTGGGIVPADLLNLSNIKLIHIHPGFLPDIRGADCVLWSTLLTAHPSASCFYMSPGIDTGDVIKPCWLPAVSFDFDPAGIDLKTLYRAVYSYFDPWVRCCVLRELLREHKQYADLPALGQHQDEGLTFHFMHPRYQALAIQKLFVPG